ncbi:MAG: NADH-quinone oxidoreductase subunit J [Nitrospirae bacterium]|nr:NADH-quinone oxidoreductase subunit J [Nitrospirota bacterium]
MSAQQIIFSALVALTLGTATVVVFSRNIVRAAFALFGTFAGVAGLYILLSAEFLAGVQVFVYVGGIQILVLFGVMLTRHSYDVQVSRSALTTFPAVLVMAGLGFVLWRVTRALPPGGSRPETDAGTAEIGNALVGQYLFPFELISLVMVITLLGAVILVRKELRPEGKPE